MHQPRPYGLAVNGGAITERDGAAIELLARRLTAIKQLGGLDSLRLVRELPDGGYVVAQDMGGVFKAVAHKPKTYEAPETDGLAKDYIPMLFSGSITRYMVRDGEPVGVWLTEVARRRLAGFQKNGNRQYEMAPEKLELQRFRIEYADKFRYFEPAIKGIYTYTQWHRLRPGWYSGAMAELVQVVSGYGRQDLASLPDNRWERARWRLPADVQKRITQELGNVRLPGYTGLPPEQGQITFDYSARRCTGVAFDEAGKPWLLRVDAQGVYAMPLPVVPATTTQAFQEYVEEVGDTEVQAVLERFGGMPSGEGFPEKAEDFQAWERAGVIIRVCGVADFYQHSAMYDACGWSWNSKGTEGFNTCWEFDAQKLIHVHAYSMWLRLGSAEGQGRLPSSWHLTDPEQQQALNAYLAGVYASTGNDARGNAIRYKLRRRSAQELLARRPTNFEAEVRYWDEFKDTPIASHAGSVQRVLSGPIYSPAARPPGNGRLKFPVLTGEGCASFQLHSEEYKGPAVPCDTVVFGCYVQDELKTIKYFYDEREFYKEEESTFEPVMIVGSWEKTTTTGVSGLAGNFYTTDFDDRKEIAPTTTHTKIIGRDLGYGEPAYVTPSVMFRVGHVSRARYYEHREEVRVTEGSSMDAGVCVPVFCRDAIQYAYQESSTGKSERIETFLKSIADPTSYEFWTHDPIFHWLGSTNAGNVGEPRPKDGNPVYLDTMIYSPTEMSDFADSGNWLNFPVGSFMDITGIVGVYLSRSQPKHANGVLVGGQAPGWERFYSSKSEPGKDDGKLCVSMPVAKTTQAKKGVPHNWYFAWSPIELAGQVLYFYRDTIFNAFGSAKFASIDETDAEGRRLAWGYSKHAAQARTAIFIGVVNE